MSPEQERWAFASKLLDTHGAGIRQHVFGQLQRMVAANDAAGVKFWEDIQTRIVQLSPPKVGSKPN